MVLHHAMPDRHLAGKPQCHIVALAKEQGVSPPALAAR